MCGVLGIIDQHILPTAMISRLISGLSSLQNRGQDSVGVVVDNSPFIINKKLGLVSNITNDNYSNVDKSNIGIGHVTQGDKNIDNAQPMIVEEPLGIAIAHNGNVTNFKEVRNQIADSKENINTTNDVELILKLFLLHLKIDSKNNFNTKALIQAVEFVQSHVIGAYSVLLMIRDYGILAFTDQNGIRPLYLGKKSYNGKISYAFCSETSALDKLGYCTLKKLIAGEVVLIKTNGQIYNKDGIYENYRPCIFEDLYFSKSTTKALCSNNKKRSNISDIRYEIGGILGKKIEFQNIKPDIVLDVPDTGYYYAKGFAKELDIPYKKAIIKKNIIRTFICSENERNSIVKHKFKIKSEFVRNKKIAVIDDSIVRGTISKYITNLLRIAGAEEIYFVSGSPMIASPCIYGIDMSRKEEMISYKRDIDNIAKYIGADRVLYLKLDELKNIYSTYNFCDACFTGKYPTVVNNNIFLDISQEKNFRTRQGETSVY